MAEYKAAARPSSQHNRGKNADLLDRATKSQSVPIFILGASKCGKRSLTSTVIGENCVRETKYEGIIKVCKPISKADGIDVTATCIDTSRLMATVESSTDDKIVQLASDIDNLVKNSKGVIIVCFCMYEQINTFTLRILALLHKSLGSKFWSHVVMSTYNRYHSMY